MTEQEMRLDIADQLGRNVGNGGEAFVQKMERRLRRKFGVRAERAQLATHTERYAAIYAAALQRLPDFIQPSSDGQARLENVRFEDLLAALRERFGGEDPEALRALLGWVVFYDYLH